jgi:nicotinate-nucleotide adenylyltransferase
VTHTSGADVQVLDAPLLEISATYIRQLVREKKSIRYLVPPAVEEEIIANRYFRN